MQYIVPNYRSEKWRQKRNEILQRDKNTCQNCGEKFAKLHVHHIYYLPFRQIWQYDNSILITLCENCHNQIHELKYTAEELIKKSFFTTEKLKEIIKTINDNNSLH